MPYACCRRRRAFLRYQANSVVPFIQRCTHAVKEAEDRTLKTKHKTFKAKTEAKDLAQRPHANVSIGLKGTNRPTMLN